MIRKRVRSMRQRRPTTSKKLGADLTAGGFHVTQNLSEIFTAVQIIAVAGSEEDRPRKASVAERLQRSASMLNAMLCYMI